MDELSHSVAFAGRQRLVSALDAAVSGDDPTRITAAVKQVLQCAIADPAIQLPACVHQPLPGRHARRELHRSRALGYCVVAMCWGPGQRTPLHDHDARWCVEGVWQGELVVTPYALQERRGDRYRFRAQPALHGPRGSAGSLIPPHEYHTLRNASDTAVAVSLHVYETPLERCALFEPLADGWYQRRVESLQTDAA